MCIAYRFVGLASGCLFLPNGAELFHGYLQFSAQAPHQFDKDLGLKNATISKTPKVTGKLVNLQSQGR
jgi:hypothetical protein